VEGLAVLAILILTPLVLVPAFFIVDSRRVALKRVLGVLAVLSPTPMAWMASSIGTRFEQNACYSQALGHVLALSEQYTKQHGDAAPQRLTEVVKPLMFGYETDCEHMEAELRKLVVETGVPQ
jgi:hypothetical protein